LNIGLVFSGEGLSYEETPLALIRHEPLAGATLRPSLPVSTLEAAMRRRTFSRIRLALLVAVVHGCAVAAKESPELDHAFPTVEVTGVAVDPSTQMPIVLLREPESGRVVPIWIGLPEAEAIARAIEGVTPPRPMTHDLLASTVSSLGGRVDEVIISQQRAGTYYGVIRLTSGGRDRVEIDSRPSDGLALALRTGATIRVARDLLLDSLDDAPPPPRALPTT
jgi:uncharacterized protein